MRQRQVDLPDDVRAKFPASLGTLKQMKVLTRQELVGKIQEERRDAYGCYKKCKYSRRDLAISADPYYQLVGLKVIRRHLTICILKGMECDDYQNNCTEYIEDDNFQMKRPRCTHLAPKNGYMEFEDPMPSTKCLLDLIDEPEFVACEFCPKHEPCSTWQINIGIAPINTGNIELPSIHQRRVKNG
jgi:hypothetical protein